MNWVDGVGWPVSPYAATLPIQRWIDENLAKQSAVYLRDISEGFNKRKWELDHPVKTKRRPAEAAE